jgi:hypothetical protein
MTEDRGQERYEPLPGVFKLPGFLIAKLSPRGRRIFWAGAAVALVGLVVLAAVMIPRITETKREQERKDRADEARALVERKRDLRREQSPRTGRVETAGGTALESSLERAIVADVALRVREGTVQNPAIRTDCKGLGRLGRKIAFSCIAVTSVIPGGNVSRGGLIGYPYRAVGDPRKRRFTFCKVAGHPGEGSNEGRPLVPFPDACGG